MSGLTGYYGVLAAGYHEENGGGHRANNGFESDGHLSMA